MKANKTKIKTIIKNIISITILFPLSVFIVGLSLSWITSPISEFFADLNEKRVIEEMKENNFVLVAKKDDYQYDNECNDLNNHIVDKRKTNGTVYIFCEKENNH